MAQLHSMTSCNGQHAAGGPGEQRQESGPTAHDWEEVKYQNKDIFDDGTMTFFWRAHRLTTLLVFTLALIYVALWEKENYDPDYNTKRGIFAATLAFILFTVTHTPDGPFKRPHPVLWRLMLVICIVYELFLVFLLFQTVDDARQLMRHIDPNLGKPLPEKNYGGNCRLYDPENTTDPFHNIWDKMDGFVAVHFFGWWLKTLIIRDWWLCTVISVMFEVMEYTLEHQLANFSECWWDHWIMDVVICNGFGIYLGLKTLNYLKMKPYHWRGMWNIPSYRGKLTRILKQFTPYSWMEFDWRPTSSLKRWLSVLIGLGLFLWAELNTFTLKFVLWIPPSHFLCLGRVVLYLFWGAVAMREFFQMLDDPKCNKMGPQTFIALAATLTEILITLKFGWETLTMPLPRHIQIFWVLFLSGIALWTLWHFYLQRLLSHTEAHWARTRGLARRRAADKASLGGAKRSDGIAVEGNVVSGHGDVWAERAQEMNGNEIDRKVQCSDARSEKSSMVRSRDVRSNRERVD